MRTVFLKSSKNPGLPAAHLEEVVVEVGGGEVNKRKLNLF